MIVKARHVVHQSQRHGAVYFGLKLKQDVKKHPLSDALPCHLYRPHDVFELFLEQRRNVITAVILECTEVHQIRDLERGKPFDQLLNKFRVAEQFLVAGFKSRPGTDLKSVPTLVLALLPWDRFQICPSFSFPAFGTDFKSVPALSAAPALPAAPADPALSVARTAPDRGFKFHTKSPTPPLGAKPVGAALRIDSALSQSKDWLAHCSCLMVSPDRECH